MKHVLADYEMRAETHTGLVSYFDFYANKRPHQSLDYQTPTAVYFAEHVQTRLVI